MAQARLIFDIGANVGKFALANAATTKKIVAIEPNPDIFQKLQKNTLQYGNIECLEYAVSNQSNAVVNF